MRVSVELMNGTVYEVDNIDQWVAVQDFFLLFRGSKLNPSGEMVNIAGFNSKAVLRYWIGGAAATEIIVDQHQSTTELTN